MNRPQRAVAWIASHGAMSREQFLKVRPAHLLDALESKGYLERRGDYYAPTESGTRFYNDQDDRNAQ